MNFKKIAILSGIILIVGIFSYFVVNPKRVEIKQNKEINTDKNSAGEEYIKNANKEAVRKAQSATIKIVRPIDKADHYLGELNVPVQLIIYDDFTNPFSAQFYDTILEIREYFKDKVVIAFRHFPLSFNTLAVPAAIVSECAAEQGKFWEMHDLLYKTNKDQQLSFERFKFIAEELALDTDQFNKCLDTEKYIDKIQAHVNEAKSFSVSGAPASFVNSEPVPGAVPWQDFTDSSNRERKGMKSIIERHLKQNF